MTSDDSTAASEAELGPLGRLYEGVLLNVEQAIVVLCLLLVLGLAFLELVFRNLGIEALNLTNTQIVTYYLSFHLGLYAAVLACRSVSHISIDALSPLLPIKVKHGVRSVLFLVSALTSVVLSYLAWEYIQELPETQAIIPGLSGFHWSERLWKFPLVVAFLLMGLHFAVHVVKELKAFPDAPMTREDPTASDDGAAAPVVEDTTGDAPADDSVVDEAEPADDPEEEPA